MITAQPQIKAQVLLRAKTRRPANLADVCLPQYLLTDGCTVPHSRPRRFYLRRIRRYSLTYRQRAKHNKKNFIFGEANGRPHFI
jgi:hypothetical protein